MRLFGRRRLPRISREAAMAARPERLPALRREERDNGGALVTVRAPKPGWMRLISGGQTIERTFGLDRLGVEIYDACDGRTPVRRLIKEFARRHDLSAAEAEHAVTTFLRTLMGRGMIAMAIDEDKI